ncbi:MAG: polymer-forming cytoskeletal protein [bacterium]
MAAEQVDTIVGAQVELKGSIHNPGSIHIHGQVTGDIVSEATVLIGETAIIHGPITAKQVEVAGQVHGSITAEEQIELQPKSLVKGDLTTQRLSIRPGAVFIGKSQMNLPGSEGPTEPKKRPRLEVE